MAEVEYTHLIHPQWPMPPLLEVAQTTTFLIRLIFILSFKHRAQIDGTLSVHILDFGADFVMLYD